MSKNEWKIGWLASSVTQRASGRTSAMRPCRLVQSRASRKSSKMMKPPFCR